MSKSRRIGIFGRPEDYMTINLGTSTLYNIYGEGTIKLESVTGGRHALQVEKVDCLIKHNAKAHRTKNYQICKNKEKGTLVVRRGQPFTLAITFNEKYDEKIDDLRLVFEAGNAPLPGKGTSVEITLSHEDKINQWGAKIDSQKDKTLMVTIFTPPTLYVGQWSMKIDVVKKDLLTVVVHRYVHNDPFYIIFNPWCKEDDVYMEGDDRLGEYVLNQTGGIFVGTETAISYRPWNFGQFDSCVLEVTMNLLDKWMKWTTRGKPVFVVRRISALVNSNDEDGLLVGSWAEEFPDGVAPTEWTGSVKILEKFWEERKPVRYGQCWVYSAMCTTLCRTLGIPARCVTCYQSAHDADRSLCVDIYMIEGAWKNSDYIWNFHVWNEAWLSRPDLPPGYGGWQAFDATPQELSGGIYCCGPASVRAVREGKIDLPYDGPFVLAEVNADKVFWYQNDSGQWELLEMEKDGIGKTISTKSIGSRNREDLTDQYKPKEGTFVEELVVSSAYLTINRPDLRQIKATVQDIEFDLTPAKSNKLGDDFELQFTMKNTSNEIRTINGHLEIFSTFYTGVLVDKVKTETFEKIVLHPNEEKKNSILVPHANYVEKLKEFGLLDVSMWALVEETKQHFVKKIDYRLQKPDLLIKAPTKTKMMEEMNIEVSFDNPLNVALTKCFLTVDGICPAEKIFQSNVQPKGTFLATVSVKPNKIGKSELIVNFNSKELKDINATFATEIIETSSEAETA